MAGGLTVSVRQVASYPLASAATGADLILLQSGGMGGPYSTITPATLVSTALAGSSVPLEAPVIDADQLNLPAGGPVSWGGATISYQQGFAFALAPQTAPLMTLSPAGALALPFGQMTVARDPGSAFEVATMGWVGANTVASFNNRRGTVTLSAADIYGALGICPPDCIATTSSVNAAICAAINDALRMHPGVWSWMGRVGDVFLTVADMNFAAANNPAFMPPLTIPEPPLTATDGEVVTASWVLGLLGANPPGYATEAWVTNYVATNSVASFNGRMGAVTLTLADIQGAGGAPTASPQFSGVPSAPTAAVGSNTGQIATTAFVQAAISDATAGVASFNGRTGIVVLTLPDVTGVGGAPLASPAFGGSPTAPTAPPGNSSPLIATTAFVAAAITAAGGVTSFNTRTGAVTLTLGDITGVGGAPLNSPALTGTPTAPTAATGTDNTEVATTAFVNAAITSIGIGVTSFEGRTGAVTLQANDISAAGGLINPSVALTGTPTAPTATAGTSSTQIATTAFVGAAILAGSVTTFNGRNGAVTLAAADISGAGGALLASPTFTGTPSAPTAAPGTNTTQLATAAFVTAALTTQAANSVTSFNGRQGVVTLTTADITAAGGAPIASPAFTGTPTAATATAGTSTAQLATTAFVMNAIAASTAGVTSFNSRTGAVTLQANDVSAVGGALLASPVFTGTPTAPTPAAGDNSTNIATTAFVAHALLTAAVTSFNGRTGAVTLTAADVNAAGGPYATTAQLAGYLPLTGGTLTGPLTVPSGTSAAPSLTFAGGTGFYASGGAITATGGLSAATLGTTGQLTVQGLGSFASIAASGNATVTGNVAGNEFIVPGGGFLTGGGTVAWSLNVANGTWQYLLANANPVWRWFVSPANVMTLDTVGNLVITGTLAQGSDGRSKGNIATFAPGVSVVGQLMPKTFTYNSDTASPPVEHLGFMAQDVQPVLPMAVSGSADTSYGLDTTPIIAACVNAIKQLIARVQALESNANITPAAEETA